MRKQLNLTPEEWEKVKRAKRRREAKDNVDTSWYLLAEFGSYYGYQAIKDARSNKITWEEFEILLEAGRKHHHAKLYQQAEIIMATEAIKHKKSKTKGRRILDKILKKAKIQ